MISGIAIGIRSGIPRATLGTDVAVQSTIARDRLIAALIGAGLTRVGTHAHSINFRHASGEPVQIAIDPEFDAMIDRAEISRRRSKALRDQADIALLRGDVPEPDEGW